MSKKPLLKFYSDPTKDPSFAAIQDKWYGILAKEGFKDQENTTRSDRPLKSYSGISEIYVDKFQPPSTQITSSFPESNFKEHERFLNHPEFNDLCKRLSSHGNSKLSPNKIKLIWSDYCDGKTLRQAEAKYKISDNRVCVLIQKITEWMNLMSTDVDQETQDNATIILRQYKADTDNPIIYATWRNALWFDERRDERLANDFYSGTTRQIRALLESKGTSVRIACDKDNPDFIAGYAVLVGTHLEFAYVKVDYRRNGIARLLSAGFTTIALPATKIARLIAQKKNLTTKENHEDDC